MSTISSSTTTTTAFGVTADTTGALVIQTGATPTTAVTIDTNQNTTLAGYLNAPNTFGFKNRIINGAMMIDQRNAGAAFGTSINGYCVDRYQLAQAVTGKLNGGQNYNSITPPAGFSSYVGVQTQAAYSVGSSETFFFSQYIEGNNVADLGWGAVGASTVTLSFWVRSSLTGTFGGSIRNGSANRAYPFAYTINAANTWEQKSITVAGDTTGTWPTNNTSGIQLFFSLGSGATVSGTAGSWQAANLISSTGSTSVVATLNATWYITGVQLEKGSTATSFDFRSIGTELALCQRYYETGTLYYEGYADLVLATSVGGVSSFKVTKRAVPTMAYGTFSSGYHSAVGATRNVYVDMVQRYCNVITSTGECLGYEPWTASAEL